MAEKTNDANGITKMEAVRRALATLGNDAARPDIQAYVKEHFNVEMNLDHISNCKGELAKRAGKAAKPAKKPVAAPVAAPPMKVGGPGPVVASAKSSGVPRPPSPAPTRIRGGDETHDSILLEDVLTTKTLLDRVGAERLRILIDGLAKK